MGTLNRAIMLMAAVLGLSQKDAVRSATVGTDVEYIPRFDNHSEARRCRGYGGNKSGRYWNHSKFGGAQEIARRKAKFHA